MAVVTAFPSVVGYISPETSWSNVENVFANDGSVATCEAMQDTGSYFNVRTFNFDTLIPVGSTINSVTVNFNFSFSNMNSFYATFEGIVQAISGTQISKYYSAHIASDSTISYNANATGVNNSSLLVPEITTRDALLNNALGVRCCAYRNGGYEEPVTISVDYVSITVDYTPLSTTINSDSLRKTLINSQTYEDVKRNILANVSISYDTSRIFFKLIDTSITFDTLRHTLLAQTITSDTIRKIANNNSNIADTLRKVLLSVNITEDTLRNASGSLSSVSINIDTIRHIVNGNTSCRFDTLRKKRINATVANDTLRKINKSNTFNVDSVRSIVVPSLQTVLDIDCKRVIVNKSPIAFDSVRKVGKTAIFTADLTRWVRSPITIKYDTSRLVNTELHLTVVQLLFDTTRTIAPGGDFRANTSRHIISTYVYFFDSQRLTRKQAMVFKFDTLRTSGTGFTSIFDSNRRIAMNYILSCGSNRFILTSVDILPGTLRNVIVDFLPKEIIIDNSCDTDYEYEVSITNRNINNTLTINESNTFSKQINTMQNVEVTI